MPELPEVENILQGLREKIIGRKIKNVWSDMKKPEDFSSLRGKKIIDISRRGKNIVFALSEGFFLLIHQKMTGHLLLGKWKRENCKWIPGKEGPLNDPMNLFIRMVFTFDDDSMMALSDLRRFAKVEILKEAPDLNSLGPDALEVSFNRFLEIIRNQKGKIKQVLMKQELISGIGNIYSDEILWEARVHPLKRADSLNEKEVKAIFSAMRKILKKAVKLQGDSMSDFRLVNGEKGRYQKEHKVYRRKDEECFVCKSKIRSLKIGGRTAHYCPKCQKEL